MNRLVCNICQHQLKTASGLRWHLDRVHDRSVGNVCSVGSELCAKGCEAAPPPSQQTRRERMGARFHPFILSRETMAPGVRLSIDVRTTAVPPQLLEGGGPTQISRINGRQAVTVTGTITAQNTQGVNCAVTCSMPPRRSRGSQQCTVGVFSPMCRRDGPM